MTVRSVTDVPIYVDVNQGWKDKHEALEMVHWLSEQGVEFVEQPLSKTAVDDMAWLTERSPLPIIADEAFPALIRCGCYSRGSILGSISN